jgi:hypothetical protein
MTPNDWPISPDLHATMAEELRYLLDRGDVGSSLLGLPLDAVCTSLEYFIPAMLCSKYPSWRGESFDGVHLGLAVKTGAQSVTFAGAGILITDQRMTPWQVDLALDVASGTLSACRILVGEPGDGPLGISGPEWNSKRGRHLADDVVRRLDRVEWCYVLGKSKDYQDLYSCRVCGLDQEEPPWGMDGLTPLFEHCPCCGVEFGYQDSTASAARAFREAWLAGGAGWDHAESRPAAWDPAEQLAQIPRDFL